MKPAFLRFLIIASNTLLASPRSHAATYYWDSNSSTSGFGVASGTWTVPTSNLWNTNSNGTGTLQVNLTTSISDDVYFGGNDTVGYLQSGTVNISGTVNAKNITFGSYSETITLAGGTINLGAISTITSSSLHTKTISSTLSGAATSLTKAGSGILLLSGSNTYAGQTILADGTLAITGTHSGTGAITLNSGILNLGNSTSTGSLAATVLNINGGEFRHTRNDGATQSFATTNFNSTQAAIVVNSGNTLNLGAVNRTVGTTPGFSYTGLGTLAASTANNVGGIMPGFHFVNSWAVANGAGSPITALATYTSTTVAGATASNYAGGNIDVNNSPGTLSAGIAANSLRFSTAAANTLSLTEFNALAAGGILVSTAVGGNLSSITGGSLAGAAGKDLHIIQSNASGGLVIASSIANNVSATALAKSGAGLLTLSGNNSFTGGLIINDGEVALGNSGALNSTAGSENAVNFTKRDGGTLSLKGNSVTIRSLDGVFINSLSSTHIVQNAAAASSTFTIGNSLNLNSTFDGVIQNGTGGGSLALVKKGTGTLTLTNPNSSYTGGTFIHAGTLSASRSGALGADTSTVTFAGDSTLRTQHSAYPSFKQNIFINSGVTAKFDTINQYHTMWFDGRISGSGTLWIAASDNSNGEIRLRNTSNDHTGPIRIGEGTNDGNLIVSSLADGSGPIEFGGTSGTGNLTIEGTSAVSLNNRIITLRGTTGGAKIGASGSSSMILTIHKNLAVTGVGNKTLTLGSNNINKNNDFKGVIGDGPGSVISLTKVDWGKWILSNTANTYTGATGIEGILEVKKLADGGSPSSIGQSSSHPTNLKFALADSTLRYTGTGDSTDRNFTMLGNVTLDSSGSGALAFDQTGTISPDVTGLVGTFTINNATVNGLASTANLVVGMTVTSGAFVGKKTISAINSSSSITLNSGSGISAGSFGISVGVATQRTLTLGGSNTGANTFAGTLQDSSAAGLGMLGVVKDGTGKWILTGGNTYTGPTTITAGTLEVSMLADGGNPSSIGLSTSDAANLKLGNNTTLKYAGSGGSTDRNFTINGTGAGHQATLNASGTGPVNFTNTASPAYGTTNQTRTLNLRGNNAGANTLAAHIANNGSGAASVVKNDTGTWILTGKNTYTGATTVTLGTLGATKLSNGAEPSSIGQSTNAAANLKLGNNGTLLYTGSGDTTDRGFTIDGTGIGHQATLGASGNGPVRFTNTNSPAYGTANQTRTLILAGTNTGANTLAANIANNGTGAVSIVKNDVGTWVLAGINTYTGDTIVNLGTLNIQGSISPASTVIFNGTSTLGGDGGIGGNVTVTANANLSPGAPVDTLPGSGGGDSAAQANSGLSSAASVGILSIGGNLNISAMAAGTGKLHYELGPIETSDKIAVSGTLNIGSGALGFTDFVFAHFDGFQNGTYKLITSGTAISGTLDPIPANLTGSIGLGGTGTLRISESGGDIELVVTGIVVGSPFNIWSGGAAFGADANGDGVINGMAYLFGANNVNDDARGLLPVVTESGGGLVLTFTMRDAASRGTASLHVMHSGDLGHQGTWTEVTVPETSGGPDGGVTFAVSENGVNAELNDVTATVLSSEAENGKLFGRLKATE